MKKHLELRTGERVVLRHVKESDKEGVWHNFNEVLKEGMYLPVFTPVLTHSEKDSWYENIKRDNELCIVAELIDKKSTFTIVGQCEISNLEWEAATHVGSLGIIIAKDYRNLGIGTNLIDFAIRESKKLNNKEKIILSCLSTNERALFIYEKLGFQEVGVRKQQFYMNSIYYDEILMELWIDDYLNKHDLT